jgi:hypothetical protein
LADYSHSWRNRSHFGLRKANVSAKFQDRRNVFACGTVIRVNALSWRISHCSRRKVDWAFGRGVLFWLLGVPIPIIILLALIWHY